VTDHDVIAFLSAWADNTTPFGRGLRALRHDLPPTCWNTALALQLTEATDLLVARPPGWSRCCGHALEHAGTLRAGRTHGIHAEPDVWGHRVADFAYAMARSRTVCAGARGGAVGTLSGPVGS